MAKILLFAIAFAVALWLLRRHRRRAQGETAEPRAPGAEDMVCCSGCGLHLPRGESVVAEQKFFCSDEHARAYRESR